MHCYCWCLKLGLCYITSQHVTEQQRNPALTRNASTWFHNPVMLCSHTYAEHTSRLNIKMPSHYSGGPIIKIKLSWGLTLKRDLEMKVVMTICHSFQHTKNHHDYNQHECAIDLPYLHSTHCLLCLWRHSVKPALKWLSCEWVLGIRYVCLD